jgi:hypothetical protein
MQTYMPREKFEPKISQFERAKKIRALDRLATVIGPSCVGHPNYIRCAVYNMALSSSDGFHFLLYPPYVYAL